MTRRVFFYVQHLLGVGHVFRALRIARGLSNAGFAVDFVMGGVPVPDLDFAGLNLVQLLPLKAGPDGFNVLVTATNEPIDSGIMAHRTAQLLSAFESCGPDIILIETFPFGRRQMRFELVPLLEAAHRRNPRPCIAASVRDILQESRGVDRLRETADVLWRYFDRVIVHGDPSLVALDATFPLAEEIAPLIAYSGLVVPPRPRPHQSPAVVADVVVSAGGGAVGRKLLQTAVAAKPRTKLRSARWLVLAGPNARTSDIYDLAAKAEKNEIEVKCLVPDLASVLARSTLSISQAGYNTVADILVAECKAVFVPFAQAGETEQSRRAKLLQQHGYGIVVTEDHLSGETLAAAIDESLALPQPQTRFNIDGVAGTVEILTGLAARSTTVG